MSKEVAGMSAEASNLNVSSLRLKLSELSLPEGVGHTASAGGAVRDMLMGEPNPEDWDVATSASRAGDGCV